MALSKNIRRVVTTVDANDRAVVLFDSDNPHDYIRETGNVSRLFWKKDQAPTDITGAMDRTEGYASLCPPDGGTLLRIVDFPPMTKEQGALSAGYQQTIIVFQRGHAQGALTLVGLVDEHSPHRLGFVLPSGQPVQKVYFQRLPVRLPGLAVYPGGRVALEREVGRLKAFDRVDVVQQSSELRITTAFCRLSLVW